MTNKEQMAAQLGGKVSDMSFWGRFKAGVKFAITGASDAPFGPSQPLPPVFQEMEGRQFDYPTGWNLTYTPRQDAAISFAQLRALADNYDLMRLAIETKKDQMAKLVGNVVPIDAEKDPDSRCKDIMAFMRYPDQEHDFMTWRRMLHEDLFVIDAPTIYPRMTKGGKPYALEVMDGALIARKLAPDGRTPKPPDVAYQQYIKGVPAADYTLDTLIYQPRNPRPHKAYGFGPVEQVIVTVNIAIRRQIHQLGYYTDGNTPDLLLRCPKEWNSDQIAQFQKWFDSLMMGNLLERRKARFIPDAEPYDVKAAAIKDDYDEWLARIICFAFSLPPTAFVKQMNRAVADNQREVALEEGIMPLMVWEKALLDKIIWKYFGHTDLHWKWEDIKDVDPRIQAEIDKIYLDAYVEDRNEVRQRLGLKGQAPEKPEAPMLLGLGEEDEKKPDNQAIKPKEKQEVGVADEIKVDNVERLKKKLSCIDRNREGIRQSRNKMEAAYNDFFPVAAGDMADQIAIGFAKVEKDIVTAEAVEKIMRDLDFQGWSLLIDPTEAVLTEVFKDGAGEALLQIGFDAGSAEMTSFFNERASAFAESRAADLVGMKNVGTKADPAWIVNPDSKWAITDTTRDELRSIISNAIDEGWSTETLKQTIIDSNGFSPDRAKMIAGTETAFADQNGNLTAYKASGVVHGKSWIMGSEHDTGSGCECEANAAQGVIGLEDSFQDGSDCPPAHPFCRCDLIPEVMEGE
ncbi:MAG: phage portal protein [Syntrophaceae bacterium]